jgi:glutamate racemase
MTLDRDSFVNTNPIGVFDSGVGGLSVASRLIQAIPSESLLYFADTVHVPYGGRPLSEVQGFALDICDFLIDRGAKAIVMACNISSAVAADIAQERHPNVPIIGVVRPGARAACATGSDRIGVLATKGTVDSGAYERAIHEADKGIGVVQVPCPKFVPLVEAGDFESQDALDACREYLEPIAASKCDTVILGCTHYPFLLSSLNKAAASLFEKQPVFIDPAIETAQIVAETLAARSLLAPQNAKPANRFFASSDVEKFKSNAPALLGSKVETVDLVRLSNHRNAAYTLASSMVDGTSNGCP